MPGPQTSPKKKSPPKNRPAPPASATAGTPPLPLFDWLQERSAGVLLHPTSLPGSQGSTLR